MHAKFLLRCFSVHAFFIGFFKWASVLLNFFMNWASNVVYMFLNTCNHHYTETHIVFSIFVSMSRHRPIYVVSLWWKFSLRVLLSFCLSFCQFQSSIAYKSVVCKKSVYSISLKKIFLHFNTLNYKLGWIIQLVHLR